MTTPAPTRGALRRLRCGAAGLLTGMLAVVAHTSADGQLPDIGLVALLAALMAWSASALAGRERGPVEILALVGAGQLAMHGLLTFAERAAAHEVIAVDSRAMGAAHLLATVAVVAVLAGAERAVFAFTKAVASVLPRRLAPLPATAPLRLATEPPARPVRRVLAGRVLPRRGPPVRG